MKPRNPPRVSVAVMAHPQRKDFVDQLRQDLDRDPVIIWDRHNDRWDTGRRSLLSYDPQATHHCVIQDDAIVPQDLICGVELALQHVPTHTRAGTPLCLYTGKTKPYKHQLDRRARKPGVSWLRMPSLYWGVGIVLPTPLIEPLVAWGDLHPEIRNYDLRIGAWLSKRRIPVWYPYPSLVDHRNSPSLVPGRTAQHARKAHRFIGQDSSALDQNWQGRVVDITPAPAKPNLVAQRARRRRI